MARSKALQELLESNEPKNYQNLCLTHGNEMLAAFARSPRKFLKERDGLAKALADCLRRKMYSPCKNIVEAKHQLMAGLLLRCASLPSQESLQLLDVMNYDIEFSNLFKISPNKFSSTSPFVIAIDNVNYLFSVWRDVTREQYQHSINHRELIARLEIVLLSLCGKFVNFITSTNNLKFSKELLLKHNIGDFVSRFPLEMISNAIFSDQLDRDKRMTKLKITRATMFLHAVGLIKGAYVSNDKMGEYPGLILKIAMNMLLESQVQDRGFSKYASQDAFAKTTIPIVLEFLQERKNTLHDKKQVLLQIKKSFSENNKKHFGALLSKDLYEFSEYPSEVLAAIYDLRLGLHDLQHLNRQITRYISRNSSLTLVPSELTFSPINPVLRRRLALLSVRDDSLIPLIHRIKERAIEFESVPRQSKTTYIEATYQNLTPSIKMVMNEAIDNGSHVVSLRVRGAQVISDGGSYVFGDNHLLLEFTGHGQWMLHDPLLPQEYMRFTYEDLNNIISHLFDISNAHSAAITHISVETQEVLQPRTMLRRAVTPVVSLEDLANFGSSPLVRSETVSHLPGLVFRM